jgi:hypothetical protein
VSRFEVNRRGNSVVERFLPARHANAPSVSGLQARKFPLRVRRNEIISLQHRKIQKLARHLYTNCMKPDVAGPGLTKAVAVKSGKRISTATLQLRSQNIRRHAHTISAASIRCTMTEKDIALWTAAIEKDNGSYLTDCAVGNTASPRSKFRLRTIARATGVPLE